MEKKLEKKSTGQASLSKGKVFNIFDNDSMVAALLLRPLCLGLLHSPGSLRVKISLMLSILKKTQK